MNEQGSVRDTLLVLKGQYNYYVDQSDLLTRFRTDFTSSAEYGISIEESQTFLLAKRS